MKSQTRFSRGCSGGGAHICTFSLTRRVHLLQITTRARQVQQLIAELYVYSFWPYHAPTSCVLSFQELDNLALEEAQNEDAIRKLWMETGRGRVTYTASHLLRPLSRSRCAYTPTQDKMKNYYETAGAHEDTRVAESIPHLHTIKAAVNGECDHRYPSPSVAYTFVDVERVASSLNEQEG